MHGGALEQLARRLELALSSSNVPWFSSAPPSAGVSPWRVNRSSTSMKQRAGARRIARDRLEQRFEADADADQPRVARGAPQLLAVGEQLARAVESPLLRATHDAARAPARCRGGRQARGSARPPRRRAACARA